MVAVVDVNRRADNLGLDPLPDIDFNIRCGNTLVGYATEKELDHDLTFGDMFANLEFKEKVEDGMDKVALTYQRFKEIQLNHHADMESFKQAKTELNKRLKELNNTLNRRLHSTQSALKYEDWLASHQPFHWLAEFYQIIKGNGGFDVVIGNPPYVVYTDANSSYKLKNYDTITCSNLYAYCCERSFIILNNLGRFGMIVPNSSISADKLNPLQKIFTINKSSWVSNYSWRPSKLFEGADMLLAIIISTKNIGNQIYSSMYQKWYGEYRESLFENVKYNDVTYTFIEGSIPKIPSGNYFSLIDKLTINTKGKSALNYFLNSPTNYKFYYFRAVQYWVKILDKEPHYLDGGIQTVTGEMKPVYCTSEDMKYVLISLLSSTLYFVHYITWASCQVMNSRDFRFPIDIESIVSQDINKLAQLGKKLQQDYQDNSHIISRSYSKKGRDFEMEKQHFFIKKSKPIIDEIDKVLAAHYGFTDEELDFIINYDIKYRMGKELEGEEE